MLTLLLQVVNPWQPVIDELIKSATSLIEAMRFLVLAYIAYAIYRVRQRQKESAQKLDELHEEKEFKATRKTQRMQRIGDERSNSLHSLLDINSLGQERECSSEEGIKREIAPDELRAAQDGETKTP